MPALVWRMRPARSIRRCETICASAGFSFMVGRKYWLIRILVWSSLGLRVAADCRKRACQRQTGHLSPVRAAAEHVDCGFAQANARTLRMTTGENNMLERVFK